MADSETSNTAMRIASKRSVDRALDLVKEQIKISAKRKLCKSRDRKKTIENLCSTKFTSTQKKINAATAYTKTFALIEMRNAMMNEDWPSLIELFAILLKCLHVHTIVWRYAFLIYLLSPCSDLSHFQAFIEMCIGKQYADNEYYLENLMSLCKNDNT